MKITNPKLKDSFALLTIILILGVFLINAEDIITFSQDPNTWIESNNADAINKLLADEHLTIQGNFFKLTPQNKLKLFDNSYDKKRLWEILYDNDKQKLIESFETEADLNKKKQRYLDLWLSLTETKVTEDDIGRTTTTTSPNVNFRNNLMKLLNKDQAQTLISAVTEKKVELLPGFDAQSFGYELKNNDPVFTLSKDGKTYLIPEKNLPPNVETIKFGQLKGFKSGYGVFYITDEVFTSNGDYAKGNRVLLQEGYYLQKTDGNEWKAKNIDPTKPEILIGLDPQKGQVEISPDGKVDIWGTGYSGKDGIYVKIGDQKFFPSTVGPQVQDKKSAFFGSRYAFVKPLEKDVFGLKGDMLAKVGDKTVGLHIGDIENGVVSFNPNYEKKGNENLITLTEGGLDIQGDALNGEISFSVSKNTQLKMSGNTFSVESKKGEKFYTYGTTRGGKLVRQVAGERAEWVSRKDEVSHTTSDGTRRVGTGQTTGQTPEGGTPSHVSQGVGVVVNNAVDKKGTGNFGGRRNTGESTTNTDLQPTKEAVQVN